MEVLPILTQIKKHPLILGTFLLTGAGIISRILGFFYKIFLSRTIGASALGLYQLIFPIFTLCLALSTSGIQTAISRFVAIEMSGCNKTTTCNATSTPFLTTIEREKNARKYLFGGLSISISISAILTILVNLFAPWIATTILKEPRTEELLYTMAFALIPASIHSCFNGYYYGKKDSVVPSVCQILEQIARVGATLLLYQILLEQTLPLLAIHAVWGLVISEFTGLFVCITAFTGWKKTPVTDNDTRSYHNTNIDTKHNHPTTNRNDTSNNSNNNLNIDNYPTSNNAHTNISHNHNTTIYQKSENKNTYSTNSKNATQDLPILPLFSMA
ncbi:MAG: oligosaccharide flippase family protein, partial [Lachnospiraceae bacterium]|nr:oligosaccharide flippase family protein [Lachnospiraceae bacterium]